MDAQQALADLTEISSQIQAAVVFDDKGKVAGSTVPDGDAFAKAASDLLTAAEEIKTGTSPLMQLEIATGDGSVFIVREGKATIAATTGADPTVGLVFYDLKSALRSVKPAAKRPVRASGPGEGVRGNREVPPTKEPGARKKTGTAPAARKKTGTAKRKTAAPRKKKPDAS
jgi:predicted regulator of Ras-like GTPase activity (Roadblock/LC7/MglB family)